MQVTHELQFVATCPVDGTHDLYELTIVTSRLIAVESILEAVRVATAEPAFQEAIAAGIRGHLGGDDLSLTLCGFHSGVSTTVCC